jgi:phosphohistidine phosphatase SixA
MDRMAGYVRTRVLTAEVDLVLSSHNQRTHGVFRQIVAQFEFRIIEKARELRPKRQCVLGSPGERTGR